MAVTNTNSTQVANAATVPVITNTVTDRGSKLRFAYGACTQGAAAGDTGSSFNVLYLPYNATVLPQLSLIYIGATGFDTGGTVSVGFAAYTEYDATAVTAVANRFIDAQAADTGGVYIKFGTGAGAVKTPFKFSTGTAGIRDSAGGILLTATSATAGILAGATLCASVCYVIE